VKNHNKARDIYHFIMQCARKSMGVYATV
jgi:hypothetical protein